MPRNLLIPGKYGFTPERYKTDAQTIEMWARQPIQQLIAGSGITLSPASGLATDAKGNGPNPITISASGGGGGGQQVGYFGFIAGPDLGDGGAGQFYYPFSGTNQTFGPSGNVTNFPVWPDNGAYREFGINQFNVSWICATGAGFSVNLLPLLESPPYTIGGSGNKIKVQMVLWATNIGFTDFALYNNVSAIPAGGMASFTQYDTLTTDFTLVAGGGTDLTMTAGGTPGFSGNGLVSAAGGIYFAGISGLVLVPNDSVFPS